ncbi:MAG: RluA family pseudouridine synthase [Ardenticatenaceae bacterium]
MSVMRLTVPAIPQKVRLDYWLVRRFPDFSSSLAQRLLKKGAITVNGQLPDEEEYELAGGEVIKIDWSKQVTTQPAPIELDVLYEDDQVVVVNKPARLVVHPSIGHPKRTLINALVARYPNIEPYSRGWPRLVHRLDRDTSGVLIAARRLYAARFLQTQFAERRTVKQYLALVLGHPERAHGTVEGPIGRHKEHWRKWGIVPDGRPSTTHYQILESFANSSLLLVRPITGRTHQIRVHLESIGLPIAGDELYAPHRYHIPLLTRQFLHAARLSISTPDRRKRTFYAPLPEELHAVLRYLREQPKHVPFPSDIHHIPWLPWVLDPTHHAPARFWEVEPIKKTPTQKKSSPIESQQAIEEAGFEVIELTEGFKGSEDFFEQFEDLEDFLEGFEEEEFEEQEFEEEEFEEEEFEEEEFETH